MIHLKTNQVSKGKELVIKGNSLFYWKQWPLTEKGAFQKELLTKADTIQWPSPVWEKKAYSPKGFGTFRFFIQRDNQEKQIILNFSRVLGASEVWVNGKKYATHGNLSKNDTTSQDAIPALTVEMPKEELLDVMLLVSSFNSRHGGGFPLQNTIVEKDSFYKAKERRAALEILVTFLILLFGVFQIITYTNSQKEKYFLYFGLFCLVGGSRQLFVGDTFILKLFPEMSFEVAQKLRYICYYGGLALIFLYHNHLFRGYFSKKAALVFNIIPCIGIVYVLVFPVFYATYSAPVFQFLGLLYLLLGYFLIIKALRDKRPFARFILLNLIFLTITFTNDILNAMLVIQTAFLVNLGLLTYVAFQVYLNQKIGKQKEVEFQNMAQQIEKMNQQVQTKKEEISKLLYESYHHLKSKRELVDDLKKTTYDDSISVDEIIKNLRSELLEDNQLNIIKNDIEILNYDFIQRLKASAPKLTETDLELCTYIHMGLSRKEIARLRHITVEAVRKARYRLRKKLELSADKDLEHFLNTI
ncbi:7TM diverse intracellular signaling domain-containing protein [uncultured Kordia sp.]|uniref:7TM diverse intracellular signaling domain-containing protein n=1 Tax=uncultured Kordia sp. TaxID=507699 RepID=UPI00262F708D|nr:7TM diverse intracellular signaling domain-containing protein [uncultured Kordia sp.]